MDPILEEMQRVKDPTDIKHSRYRDWVDYLCALVSVKDAEIAALTIRIGELERSGMVEMTAEEIRAASRKSGAGRPRKEDASE